MVANLFPMGTDQPPVMGNDISTAEKALKEVEGAIKTWPLFKSLVRSLYRKHPKLTLLFATAVLLLVGYLAYDHFLGLRPENAQLKIENTKLRGQLTETHQTNALILNSYQAENARLSRQVQDQTAVVSDVKRERDDAKAQLATLQLLAKAAFPNAPADQRIDLLLEKIKPLTEVLERLDALTNSPRPNLELWADGLLLTNGVYKLPVDSNGVGSITFVVKNSGGAIAENVSVSVQSLTNIQLQGFDWRSMPSMSGESPRSQVLTEILRPINPDTVFLVSTLRVSNDGVLGPIEPLTVSVNSARAKSTIQLTCLAMPGIGKLTPATFTLQTNVLLISPVEFRQ